MMLEGRGHGETAVDPFVLYYGSPGLLPEASVSVKCARVGHGIVPEV